MPVVTVDLEDIQLHLDTVIGNVKTRGYSNNIKYIGMFHSQLKNLLEKFHNLIAADNRFVYLQSFVHDVETFQQQLESQIIAYKLKPSGQEISRIYTSVNLIAQKLQTLRANFLFYKQRAAA